jgi:hypothetical protein
MVCIVWNQLLGPFVGFGSRAFPPYYNSWRLSGGVTPWESIPTKWSWTWFSFSLLSIRVTCPYSLRFIPKNPDPAFSKVLDSDPKVQNAAVWRKTMFKTLNFCDICNIVGQVWAVNGLGFCSWEKKIKKLKKRTVFNYFLKVPSHQIRLGWKWYGWIGLRGYKVRRL